MGRNFRSKGRLCLPLPKIAVLINLRYLVRVMGFSKADQWFCPFQQGSLSSPEGPTAQAAAAKSLQSCPTQAAEGQFPGTVAFRCDAYPVG